jgi:hypothetical protein
VKLSGTDEDNIPGPDLAGNKVHRYGAHAFLDIDQLHILMPVERNLGEIMGNGAGIGQIRKAGIPFRKMFMIVFVLNNIHKNVLSQEQNP